MLTITSSLDKLCKNCEVFKVILTVAKKSYIHEIKEHHHQQNRLVFITPKEKECLNWTGTKFDTSTLIMTMVD